MRNSFRQATPDEESLVAKHLSAGESLYGMIDSPSVFAIRQTDGALRYLDSKKVKPSFLQRLFGG